MSQLIRRRITASKFAAALCLISSGAATAGEIAPTLVKTTTPIRVRSAAVHTNRPSHPQPVTTTVQDGQRAGRLSNPNVDHSLNGTAELRKLLEPDGSISLNPHMSPGDMGVPRMNRFVELQSDPTIDTTRSISAARSAAVPQRRQRRSGTIQKNPLVVDKPPTLRRFGVDEVPLNLPNAGPGDSPADQLVVREQPMPARPVEDFDQAFDMLSIQPDTPAEIRGAARDVGFGMLAIDQIGNHLSDSASDTPTPSPPVQRYSTDLVLPNGLAAGLLSSDDNDDDSLRRQLSSVESNSLVETDVPPLPSPRHAATGIQNGRTVANRTPATRAAVNRSPGRSFPADVSVGTPERMSISQELDAASTEIASASRGTARQTNLHSPFRPHPSAQSAMEVDDLIAASSRQEQQAAVQATVQETSGQPDSSKPSLVQRLSNWSKGLSRKSRAEDQAPASQPVSERIAEKPSDQAAIASPKKRSGGILTQWLKSR